MMGSIDKQATINAIYEKANEELADANHHFLAGVHMATAVVRDMPEQRWIPVAERLPKNEEEVIVSIHDDSGDYAYDYTSFGWYAAAGKFWVVDNEANMRVTAWMPLPEPYREVSE